MDGVLSRISGLLSEMEYRVRDSSLLKLHEPCQYLCALDTTIANTTRILLDRSLSNVIEFLYEVVEALQDYSSSLNNLPKAMDLRVHRCALLEPLN